ncbi:esterase/lipase family protein [Agaribacterium sp. ZY112]|uniref:esterase/lipase family protein n=1 Tax=Agaribacterium sp. ZY112 TaxID=3233574 RepID=UPI003525F452
MRFLLKVFSFVGLCLFLVALKAHSGTCENVADFYDPSGCSVDAKESYVDFGSLDVKIVPADNGANLNRILYVVGPYDLDFSEGLEPLGLGNIPRDLLDKAKASNVDVVYFDFSNNNEDYLQNKGLALVQAIKKIESLRTSNQEVVLVGLSLGGVVARYALTTMEQQGVVHNVSHYISYDSPHLGAHVPLSLQYVPIFLRDATERAKADNTGWLSDKLMDIGEWLVDDFAFNHDLLLSETAHEELRKAKSTITTAQLLITESIDSNAGKQLLIQNKLYGNEMHSLGLALQAELAALGFPKNTKTNSAIANGSISGGYQAGVTGDKYLYYKSHSDSVNSYNKLWLNVHQARPNSGPVMFWGRMDYQDASEELSFGDGTDKYEKTIYWEWAPHLDDIPCSTVDVPKQLGERLGDVLSETWPNPYSDGIEVHRESSCFIPTLSALAINTVPVDTVSPVDLSQSPFDVVVANGVNDFHMSEYGVGGAMSSNISDLYDMAISDTYNYPWLVPVISLILN